MASCAQIGSLLQAWIDDELGHGERVILEQHLAECRTCRTAARKHQRVAALLFESFVPHRLKNDLAPVILENLPEMEPLRFKVKPEMGRRDVKPVRTPVRKHIIPAIAALVLFAAAVVLYAQWPPDPHQESAETVGVVTWCRGEVNQGLTGRLPHERALERELVWLNQIFHTGPESNLMLTLNGPTLLKVNERTRLSVANDREIHLEEGQIWLNVTRNSAQFRLHTPAGEVTVLGTTFDVLVKDAKTTVSVVEGIVQMNNGISTVRVYAGQQVEMVAGQPINPARQVVAEEVARWANAIRPDSQADAAAARTGRAREPEEIPAEQVFIVITSDAEGARSISSFDLAWDPDKIDAPHCGYFVHVYNDRMEELFSEHVSGDIFLDKEVSSITIPVPEEPIVDVNIIHIRLVPDYSTGSLKTSFSRISAMGI